MRSSQTTMRTFTNQCLAMDHPQHTAFPVLGRPVFGQQWIRYIHIDHGTAPNRIFNIEWRAQYSREAAVPASS